MSCVQRRHHVAAPSIRRYFNVMCLLGKNTPMTQKQVLLSVHERWCNATLSSPSIHVLSGNPVFSKLLKKRALWPERANKYHSISNDIEGAPTEDSDQPSHPRTLIRVFAVHLKTPGTLGYPQCPVKTLIRSLSFIIKSNNSSVLPSNVVSAFQLWKLNQGYDFGIFFPYA